MRCIWGFHREGDVSSLLCGRAGVFLHPWQVALAAVLYFSPGPSIAAIQLGRHHPHGLQVSVGLVSERGQEGLEEWAQAAVSAARTTPGDNPHHGHASPARADDARGDTGHPCLIAGHCVRVVRLLPLRCAGRHHCAAVLQRTRSGFCFLFALLAFAAGFIVRPFGALLFGRLGDMIGRKHTFLITMVVMGLATFAVGLLPTYASIGVAAPVVLIGLRLLQGLALGGEYGGAAVYVAEHAPHGRRGAYTAWIQT